MWVHEEARNSEEGDGSEEGVGNHIDVISYAMYITY